MTDSKPPEPPEPPPSEEQEKPSLAESLEQSVEHTVEKVGEAVERVEQKVEQAAEEVAEEAAEHVPESLRAPVRWTVKRLVLAISGGVVLALLLAATVTAYYVWNHTEWAAHELTGRVNKALIKHSDVELSVRAVRGNPLSSVLVMEPRVAFRDGGPVVLQARSMRLRYTAWALLAGRRGAVVIELDNPVIHLSRDASGQLRHPTWVAGVTNAPTTRKPRGYDFKIVIRDGDLLLPERERSIRKFDLEADVALGAGPTNVQIRTLRWAEGPYGLVLTRFRGGIGVTDDSVRIVASEFESDPLALRGTAQWARAGGPQEVEAVIARVRWNWLAKVFANRTLDVPGEGSFDLRASGGPVWRGDLRTRATWGELPLTAEGQFSWSQGTLTLDPLSGRSPAGDLHGGRLVWSKPGWEIGGIATGADPSRWDAIGVKGWPAGKLAGRFRYWVDSRGRPAAWLTARLGSSAWTGWSADSATVDMAFPDAAADSFSVRVVRRGGEFTLDARTQPNGWNGSYKLARYPLDEWPDGRASGLTGTLATGAGQVDYRDGAMFVTGALEGRTTRWFGLETAQWKLEDLKGRLMPTPDLEARARFENFTYLGVHFDSAATPAHLGDQTLAMPGLVAWAGDTTLTMSAGADWSTHGWRLTATRAELQSPNFHWIVDPPLSLSGDASGVRFDRLEAADGEARVRVTGRWAGPGGSYDWRATGERLSLERLGLPPSLGLKGTTDVSLVVSGVPGNPRWELQGSAHKPAMQGHQADSLVLALVGGPSRVEVKNFLLHLGGGGFRAEGSIDETQAAWPETLTADGVVRWLSTAARWRGVARAEAVPLEPMSRLVGIRPVMVGKLDGTVELGGRPRQPTMKIDLASKPVSWRGVSVDEAVVRAEYDSDRLRVTEFRTVRGQAASNVTGEMEIELALGRTPEVLDAPMRWRVALPNGDLALLPLVVPQLGTASGRFEVDAEVRGTPRKPELIGSARIHDGRLRIAGREEILEDVRGKFSFDAARITLDSLSAVRRTGERDLRGRVNGRGAVELRAGSDPAYRFDFSLRDFTAVESGLYAARFDGDFQITNGPRIRGLALPHVTSDNVEVRRAVVLYDFARQSEQQQVQASTQSLFWTYKIQVHANDNLRWQPPDGDIEFSADLNLDQTRDKLVIFGDMDALRGTYYFLSNRFNVRRARLTFDDVGGVDPLVDAEAVTRLTPTQLYQRASTPGASESRPGPHTITVRIQGRSSRPTVDFVDVPANPTEDPLDQAGILRELTVGRFGSGTNVAQNISDPLNSYLTRAISRQLSAELSRAFRGYITDWEIERESSVGGVRLRVGSQVTPEFRVGVGQRIGNRNNTTTPESSTAPVERDIEAEYRINRFFYITSQLSQKRSTTTSTRSSQSANFNVDLKARWEY